MNMESIIVALIAAGASIVGQLIIATNNSKKDAVDKAVRQQKLDDRLDRIDVKLEEHNNYASKMGSIETAIELIKNNISHLKEDLEELKN